MILRRAYDIITYFYEEKGRDFLDRIRGKKPLFICVIGTTETAKILGISAAGANPQITDYTPPADVELLYYGRCKCIKSIPVTPDGIPTPAIITMSALRLADIPYIVLNAGLKVKPNTPYIEIGGKPGKDIRTGRAVENPEEIFERSFQIGRSLSGIADYLVVGESIPGGTTTALAVLLAMGVKAAGKVSSSMPRNPHELKLRVVEEGMRASGISFGSMKNNPFKAVSALGDPMIPAAAGVISGAAKQIPVIMAGGTQMCAVLCLIKSVLPSVMHNLAIGTTKWIVEDRSSDICGLVSQIGNVPIIAADLDFSASKFSGLRAYELGVVKEGVGAGGSSIAAI
ncbi:MAG: nicotinate mononucleotide-dependent phosphoribosyltransferase CobT, partial [Candidatus Methanomethylicaceae archaeon]